MGKCDDLKLCRRAAAGDKTALSEIYSRYGDLLFAFIYHRVSGSVCDTEEIWQETWLAAFRKLSTYCGPSGFFTWLGAIASHKIVDHYRRRGREPMKSFSCLSERNLARLVHDGPLPEEILMQQATRTHVVHALASLPDEYRTALVARYADGHSVKKVAQKLGKSYRATESLLSRARTAFRKALEEQPGE
ncbi:RNA polymerase sigma factor [Planctomycetota bacterium]